MPIDRRDDDRGKARAAALLEQARDLRSRADDARRRARELIAEASELVAREERRAQREMLLKRANEALRIAKASSPLLLRFPVRNGKKTTG